MKKWFIITIVALLIAMSAIIVSLLEPEIKTLESPTGDYQIVSWMIDKGGFGYGGSFYLKEKGWFTKWHRLGSCPFSAKWLSDEEFSIDFSYPLDGNYSNFSKGNYTREYHVDEFFSK